MLQEVVEGMLQTLLQVLLLLQHSRGNGCRDARMVLISRITSNQVNFQSI